MAAPISFHGALFTEGSDITPAITKAAHVAKAYGLGLVKARTPVDTSELKSNWKAALEANGIRYVNDTPYAAYVEHGTSKMLGRHMLGDSLTDIETVFYNELSREIGKTLAFDLIEVADNPSYTNTAPAPTKGNKAGKKEGLTKRKYSKKYLFSNPNDIVSLEKKKEVNAARPRFQKYDRKFVPEFKIREQRAAKRP